MTGDDGEASVSPHPSVSELAQAVADKLVEPDSPFVARLASLLGAALAQRVPAREVPRLLSFRAAARLLGVGRGSTLPHLVSEGLVRTVRVNGRVLIPLGEVERIEVEGLHAEQGRRRARAFRRPPLAADEIKKAKPPRP